MNAHDALVLVFARNMFYKRLHYLALAAVFMMVITIGVLIWMLIYVAHMQAMPIYFATNNVGQLIHVDAIEKPEMTDQDVGQWAAEAIEAAYSYDYLNFHSQLQGAQKYFTGYGWSKYITALEASNNLDGVKSRRWIGLAKVIDQPKLLDQGILKTGEFAWKFRMNVLVSYLRPPKYDEATMRLDPLTLTVLVERQPALQSYKGLGIAQIVAEIGAQPIDQAGQGQ